VDIDVVHVSLLGELDPDFTDDVRDYMAVDDPAGYWAVSYTRILRAFAPNFARALAAIADAPDGAVVFHCVVGKDRTGLVAALLLRLAGAPIEEIARDYALTAGLRSRHRPLGRGRARRGGARTPPVCSTRLEACVGARQLEHEYGRSRRTSRAGLDEARIERLRKRLHQA
jgi:protein-tyrosine phosphatase